MNEKTHPKGGQAAYLIEHPELLEKLDKEVISMTVKIIDQGDKSRKGNARCPQCGKKVLIEGHFGDPPKCGDCGIPYVPSSLRPSKFS